MQCGRAPAEPAVSPIDIERLNRILRSDAGFLLDPQQSDFLASRLGRVMTRRGARTLADYCLMLESGGTELRKELVESVTTHTTSFFRERGQYQWLLDEGFDALCGAGSGTLRELSLWSAACSTGQELYSALMAADLYMRGARRHLRVSGVGTDVSGRVIRAAGRAVYTEEEIDSIPLDHRREYLLESTDGNRRFRIVERLRAQATWRHANLVDRASLPNARAHIVFLRNVLIYFRNSEQRQILDNVLSKLVPGGLLLMGHSETALVRGCGLETIRPTIYRKPR